MTFIYNSADGVIVTDGTNRFIDFVGMTGGIVENVIAHNFLPIRTVANKISLYDNTKLNIEEPAIIHFADFKPNIRIGNNGGSANLRIGVDEGDNTAIKYIIDGLVDQGREWDVDEGLFDIRGRSTLELYGAYVKIRCGLGFGFSGEDDGYLKVKGLVWDARGALNIPHIRILGAGWDSVNTHFLGCTIFPARAFQRFKNAIIDSVPYAITMNWGNDTLDNNYIFEDLVVKNITGGLCLIGTNAIVAPKGSTVAIRNGDSTIDGILNNVVPRSNNFDDPRTVGTFIKISDIDISVRDFETNDLLDYKLFIKDSDSGNRTLSEESDNTVSSSGEDVIHHYDRDIVVHETVNGTYSGEIVKDVWNRSLSHYNAHSHEEVVWDVRLPISYTISSYLYASTRSIISGNVIGKVSEYIRLFRDRNIVRQDVVEVAQLDHIVDYNDLYDYLKYWTTQDAAFDFLNSGELLESISASDDTFSLPYNVTLIQGRNVNPIQYDSNTKTFMIYVGDAGNFGYGSIIKKLKIGGLLNRNAIYITGLYEYVDVDGNVITSHHIYPTTDLDVIKYNNKQNIHIHAKYRNYRRLETVTVFGKNGNQIITTASFPSSDINVGDVVAVSDAVNNEGIRITEVGSASQITSFRVVDASSFNVGDKIYVSTHLDIVNENIFELEELVGQISTYFAYPKSKYYEVEIDVFGDVKRSINTYAELPEEVTPMIEVIAGAEEIGMWRIDRANGITVDLTDTEITLIGDWNDKSPEQLLWNIHESIAEWNKDHPNQADKRYEIDYFETSGLSIIWHKIFTTLSGFYASKNDTYDLFVYLDGNSDLLYVDVGLETETTSQFVLRIMNVKVGDKVAYLVNGASTYKVLEDDDVNDNGETILVLDKGERYDMRIRRKGFNEPLYSIDDNNRVIGSIFIIASNVSFENTFSGDVLALLGWDADDSRIIFLDDINISVQNSIDAIWEYNYLFPQGILGESLINSEYGFLENILTLNYKTLTKSHIEKKEFHKAAVYEALAIQRGHNADGSPLWSYLESAEIDPLNFETFVVHYYHNFNNTVSTTGTKALLDTPLLTVNVAVLLGEPNSHFTNTVIPHTLSILNSRQLGANSGTLTFQQGVPSHLEYHKKYRLFHKVSDAEDVILEVVVYSFIRIKVQIRTVLDDGTFADADEHITWGVHETLQGGFTDNAKEKLDDTLENTIKIGEESDTILSNTNTILKILKEALNSSFILFLTEFLDYSYILLKQHTLIGDKFEIDVPHIIDKYVVSISDGGLDGYNVTAEIHKVNSEGRLSSFIARQVIPYIDRVDEKITFTFDNVFLPKGTYFVGIHGDIDDVHATYYRDVVDGRGHYTVDDTMGSELIKVDDKEVVSELSIKSGNIFVDLEQYCKAIYEIVGDNTYGLEALKILIERIPLSSIDDIANAVKVLMESDGSTLSDLHKMSFGDIVFTESGDKVNIVYNGNIVATFDGITVSAYDPLKWAGGRKKI